MMKKTLLLVPLTLLLVTNGARPADAPADAAATKLLTDARATRAVWGKDFAGFTADVTVNADGTTAKGTLQVSAEGKVTLEGIDAAKFPWAKQILKVNIDHRLPSAPSEPTPCRFSEEKSEHPLGREIVLIGDGMGSRYRIKDNQITVVNREGPGPRFTTTVLASEKNAEEKYLPTAFVITFWSKDGELLHSDHHTETFARTGAYDLPTSLRVVSATKKGVEVRVITLTGHRLTTR